jgi:hypothetical protein
MSLKRALDRMPDDRATEQLLRRALSAFRRHPDEWLTVTRLAPALGTDERQLQELLLVLSDSFVLDSEDGPARFRYRPDTLSELEIERFLRVADTHGELVQNNVAKFRQRFSY